MADPTGQALTVECLLAADAAETAARPLPRERLAAPDARLGAAKTKRTTLAPTETATEPPSLLAARWRAVARPPTAAAERRLAFPACVGTESAPLEPTLA
jgi:hypothetical protein